MPTIRPVLLSLVLTGALAAGAAMAQTAPAPMPTQAIPPATTPTRHPGAPLTPPAAATTAPPGSAMSTRTDERLQQQQRTLHNQVRSMSNRNVQSHDKPMARSAEDTSLYPATSGTTH